MEFGNVMHYLKIYPEAHRVLLLSEIASGTFATFVYMLPAHSSPATEYLHSRGIIHGDLRGVGTSSYARF
jgi:serine/threonine protein kinase